MCLYHFGFWSHFPPPSGSIGSGVLNGISLPDPRPHTCRARSSSPCSRPARTTPRQSSRPTHRRFPTPWRSCRPPPSRCARLRRPNCAPTGAPAASHVSAQARRPRRLGPSGRASLGARACPAFIGSASATLGSMADGRRGRAPYLAPRGEAAGTLRRRAPAGSTQRVSARLRSFRQPPPRLSRPRPEPQKRPRRRRAWPPREGARLGWLRTGFVRRRTRGLRPAPGIPSREHVRRF